MSRRNCMVTIALLTTGCAHLATVQRETAALVLAAQQTREACEAEPEPRPEVCKAVDRLLAEIEPYVEVAE